MKSFIYWKAIYILVHLFCELIRGEIIQILLWVQSKIKNNACLILIIYALKWIKLLNLYLFIPIRSKLKYRFSLMNWFFHTFNFRPHQALWLSSIIFWRRTKIIGIFRWRIHHAQPFLALFFFFSCLLNLLIVKMLFDK